MLMINRSEVSRAIAHLVPAVIRGARLDFLMRQDVTHTQFFVLIAIHSYRDCTMTMIAKNMGIRLPSATGLVNRLVRNQWVERTGSSEDRRKVLIRLTPKGRRFIAQFQDAVGRRWNDVLGFLDKKELETFYGVIKKIRVHLG